MVPKFLEGFSIRMFFADAAFFSKKRSTCLLAGPSLCRG